MGCVCEGHKGGIVVMDVIWCRLCVSMIYSELGKGATSEARNYLIRATNVCAVFCYCLETIDACIWWMFVFMSVVATVYGSMGMFVV